MFLFLRRAILSAVLLLILAAIVMFLTAQPARQMPFFETYPSFMNIGHQGGYELWPSDTLTGFDGAKSVGSHMLELDIHMSKDGHLVVMHDATVDRTTNGRGLIKNMTLPQLKTLDAGYRWFEDAPDGSWPFRGQGIQVPTLDEVFTRYPAMPISIEIKQETPSLVEPLCDLIKRHKADDRSLVASFYQDSLDEFREACPNVVTSMGRDEITEFFILSTLGLHKLYSPKAQVLHVPLHRSGFEIVTKRFVNNAHEIGLRVQPWTINKPSTMRDLIKMNVDGIITDRPDYLANILRESKTSNQ